MKHCGFLGVIVLLFIFSDSTVAQKDSSAKVSYQHVFTMIQQLDNQKVYELTEEWILTRPYDLYIKTGVNDQRLQGHKFDKLYMPTQVPIFSFNDGKKIVIKGGMRFSGRKLSCLRRVYLNFNLSIRIDGTKVLMDIDEIRYIHFNYADDAQFPIWNLDDVGPCSSEGAIEDLIKCQDCKSDLNVLYKSMNDELPLMLARFERFIINYKF